MKLPYNIYVHLIFYICYICTEIFIQQNHEYNQWLRWHLSDIFAGPSICLSFCYIAAGIDTCRDTHIISFVPLVSMILCIIYEFIQKTDYMDIACYIGGTIAFYIISLITK